MFPWESECENLKKSVYICPSHNQKSCLFFRQTVNNMKPKMVVKC